MTRLALTQAWRGPGTGTPVEPVTYLTIDSTVKIVADGNSIWSSAMGPAAITALPPWTAFIASSGCAVANTSLAGQTWAAMAANLTDVQAAWVDGKTNVVMSMETRNSVFNGFSVAQTLGQIADYYENLLSAHPWLPVYAEALPSDGIASAADENAAIVEIDQYVRNNLAEFGIRKYVRFRDLSAFAGDGASRQGFMTSTTTCLEAVSPWVHPDGFPREQIAARMVRDVQRIPV